MGIGTNAFTTYDAVGMREDLINLIENIAPAETWFTNKIGNVDAKARYHEFQKDTLPAPAANAHLEGEVATANAVTATIRSGNWTQILAQTFAISESEDAVTKAGRDSEVAYQKAKFLKVMANDIEYALLVNSAAASGGTATARQLLGAVGFITTNVTTATTATTASAIQEAQFNTNLGLVWACGLKPQYTLCAGPQKQGISAFTGNNTRFVNLEDSKLESTVDVYRSDYGTVAVVLSYAMQNALKGTVFNFSDMGMWRKAWLRKPRYEELAKTGDFSLWDLRAELTLECREEKSAGKMTGFKQSYP